MPVGGEVGWLAEVVGVDDVGVARLTRFAAMVAAARTAWWSDGG